MAHLSSEKKSCSFCHQSTPPLAQSCSQCGATKYKGFSIIETLACALVGLVIIPAFSTFFVSLSLWTILFAALGLGGGLIVSYHHFPAKKWKAPR